MEHLERLWVEVLQESELDLTEAVYSHVIASGDTHRLWNSSTDENLRRVICSINTKLNDGKTREYGMVTLSRFIEQIDPARLVAIHEGLASSLHLSLKCLEVDTTHQFLAKIFRHARKVPELNQLISSTIVPKVLSLFCDSNRTPSSSEFKLVRVCLRRYHGACGNQRSNLEKTLLTMLDSSEDEYLLELVYSILPLLSSAGGGGTNGVKHSEDWLAMLLKLLASIEDCLVSLFGDACPMLNTETIFEAAAPRLGISICKHRNVFQRITATKTRLLTLTRLLGHYLSDAFPSPKPVALKSILNLVRKMLILDPINVLKSFASPPKEYVFLSVVIPDIRYGAYELLRSLTLSVGSNIMPEASTIEELSLQELKWMSECPDAFAKLKTGLFSLILSYLETTKNQANSKTIITWAKHLIVDIQIKKISIELNQAGAARSKNHSNRKGSTKVAGKTKFLSTNLSSAAGDDILPSNSEISNLALRILALLIPSLDAPTHKIVHVAIGRTAVIMMESETYPSPYDDLSCRQSLYSAILSLIQNPHPLSPISLGFFANLLRKTEFDDGSIASSHQLRSWFERIAHPIAPTLNFPTVLPPEEPLPAEGENDIVDFTPETEVTDGCCQTDSMEVEVMEDDANMSFPASNLNQQNPIQLDQIVRFAVESTLVKMLKSTSQTNLSGSFQDTIHESEDDGQYISALSSPQSWSSPPVPAVKLSNGNAGGSKRKYEGVSLDVGSKGSEANTVIINGHGESVGSKRSKGTDASPGDRDNVEHISFESMLSDFVDT